MAYSVTNLIMTDKNLYVLCKRYGAKALRARARFLGLLPEVYKRRLFEKKGYGSIFEFASKLAGVSHEQVRMVLGLEQRLSDKPVLHGLLVKGEVSVNKLARVVSIATVENQAELAGYVKSLSKSALETWVRDEKRRETQVASQEVNDTAFAGMRTAVLTNKNGLQMQENGGKSLPGLTCLEDVELLEKLPAELRERLRVMLRKGIDVGAILTELLDWYEQEIAEEKAEIVESAGVAGSRYIPVRIKKVLVREYGKKCSVAGCGKPSRVIHHTQRFALERRHDPRFLAPLCHEHHEIAHAIDARMVEYKKRRW